MAGPVLLLRVATAWPLPGLGLLALPDGPAPPLAAYPLHAALAVEAVLPGGARRAATATVEEVSRPGAGASVRGVLLDFGGAVELGPGAEIGFKDQKQRGERCRDHHRRAQSARRDQRQRRADRRSVARPAAMRPAGSGPRGGQRPPRTWHGTSWRPVMLCVDCRSTTDFRNLATLYSVI